ncbi:MAG: hypothetical protein M1833_002154 [Piccolia ochrophora]|nr:MAG: hypothetical protein M1833_002154 [Piccolia ochrophora]
MLPRIALSLGLVLLLLGLASGDADFESVRTRMKKDRSGKGGDSNKKYFHESFPSSLRWKVRFLLSFMTLKMLEIDKTRFASKPWPYKEQNEHLSILMKCYLATMVGIGAETWIMHGTLLGWWWNQKIMPWDSDLDVQVSESTMHFLATYYNMSTYHYHVPGLEDGRDFLFEVNPNYINRERSDKLNVIDARFTDTESGLFIDITTVRKNETHPQPGMLSCKDKHEYKESDIFPLRSSLFEGMPVKVPYAYTKLLTQEYSAKALTRTEWEQ